MLSTQLEAKAEAAAETSSPELVDSTNVHLDKPAPNLHAWVGSRQAVIKVWSKDGSVFELPTTGFQRVAAIPGDVTNAVEVHINLDDAVVSLCGNIDAASGGGIAPASLARTGCGPGPARRLPAARVCARPQCQPCCLVTPHNALPRLHRSGGNRAGAAGPRLHCTICHGGFHRRGGR